MNAIANAISFTSYVLFVLSGCATTILLGLALFDQVEFIWVFRTLYFAFVSMIVGIIAEQFS